MYRDKITSKYILETAAVNFVAQKTFSYCGQCQLATIHSYTDSSHQEVCHTTYSPSRLARKT